jgi:hypothetical protein
MDATSNGHLVASATCDSIYLLPIQHSNKGLYEKDSSRQRKMSQRAANFHSHAEPENDANDSRLLAESSVANQKSRITNVRGTSRAAPVPSPYTDPMTIITETTITGSYTFSGDLIIQAKLTIADTGFQGNIYDNSAISALIAADDTSKIIICPGGSIEIQGGGILATRGGDITTGPNGAVNDSVSIEVGAYGCFGAFPSTTGQCGNIDLTGITLSHIGLHDGGCFMSGPAPATAGLPVATNVTCGHISFGSFDSDGYINIDNISTTPPGGLYSGTINVLGVVACGDITFTEDVPTITIGSYSVGIFSGRAAVNELNGQYSGDGDTGNIEFQKNVGDINIGVGGTGSGGIFSGRLADYGGNCDGVGATGNVTFKGTVGNITTNRGSIYTGRCSVDVGNVSGTGGSGNVSFELGCGNITMSGSNDAIFSGRHAGSGGNASGDGISGYVLFGGAVGDVVCDQTNTAIFSGRHAGSGGNASGDGNSGYVEFVGVVGNITYSQNNTAIFSGRHAGNSGNASGDGNSEYVLFNGAVGDITFVGSRAAIFSGRCGGGNPLGTDGNASGNGSSSSVTFGSTVGIISFGTSAAQRSYQGIYSGRHTGYSGNVSGSGSSGTVEFTGNVAGIDQYGYRWSIFSGRNASVDGDASGDSDLTGSVIFGGSLFMNVYTDTIGNTIFCGRFGGSSNDPANRLSNASGNDMSDTAHGSVEFQGTLTLDNNHSYFTIFSGRHSWYGTAHGNGSSGHVKFATETSIASGLKLGVESFIFSGRCYGKYDNCDGDGNSGNVEFGGSINGNIELDELSAIFSGRFGFLNSADGNGEAGDITFGGQIGDIKFMGEHAMIFSGRAGKARGDGDAGNVTFSDSLGTIKTERPPAASWASYCGIFSGRHTLEDGDVSGTGNSKDVIFADDVNGIVIDALITYYTSIFSGRIGTAQGVASGDGKSGNLEFRGNITGPGIEFSTNVETSEPGAENFMSFIFSGRAGSTDTLISGTGNCGDVKFDGTITKIYLGLRAFDCGIFSGFLYANDCDGNAGDVIFTGKIGDIGGTGGIECCGSNSYFFSGRAWSNGVGDGGLLKFGDIDKIYSHPTKESNYWTIIFSGGILSTGGSKSGNVEMGIIGTMESAWKNQDEESYAALYIFSGFRQCTGFNSESIVTTGNVTISEIQTIRMSRIIRVENTVAFCTDVVDGVRASLGAIKIGNIGSVLREPSDPSYGTYGAPYLHNGIRQRKLEIISIVGSNNVPISRIDHNKVEIGFAPNTVLDMTDLGIINYSASGPTGDVIITGITEVINLTINSRLTCFTEGYDTVGLIQLPAGVTIASPPSGFVETDFIRSRNSNDVCSCQIGTGPLSKPPKYSMSSLVTNIDGLVPGLEITPWLLHPHHCILPSTATVSIDCKILGYTGIIKDFEVTKPITFNSPLETTFYQEGPQPFSSSKIIVLETFGRRLGYSVGNSANNDSAYVPIPGLPGSPQEAAEMTIVAKSKSNTMFYVTTVGTSASLKYRILHRPTLVSMFSNVARLALVRPKKPGTEKALPDLAIVLYVPLAKKKSAIRPGLRLGVTVYRPATDTWIWPAGTVIFNLDLKKLKKVELVVSVDQLYTNFMKESNVEVLPLETGDILTFELQNMPGDEYQKFDILPSTRNVGPYDTARYETMNFSKVTYIYSPAPAIVPIKSGLGFRLANTVTNTTLSKPDRVVRYAVAASINDVAVYSNTKTGTITLPISPTELARFMYPIGNVASLPAVVGFVYIAPGIVTTSKVLLVSLRSTSPAVNQKFIGITEKFFALVTDPSGLTECAEILARANTAIAASTGPFKSGLSVKSIVYVDQCVTFALFGTKVPTKYSHADLEALKTLLADSILDPITPPTP